MNNYQTAKEKARQEAMEYQLTFSDHSYSYAELVEIQLTTTAQTFSITQTMVRTAI